MRYFMTVHEAVGLVIQSTIFCEGGEIFVSRHGEQMKISDMARQMIASQGWAREDIEIRFIGLRPGEKLYEDFAITASASSNQASKDSALVSAHAESRTADTTIDEIETKLVTMPEAELKTWIQSMVPNMVLPLCNWDGHERLTVSL